MGRRAPVVEVEGARQLRSTLKAAGDDLSELKAANEAVGNMVVGVARGMAPTVSGALAGSIRSNRAAGGVTLKAGTASIPYAGAIHWGWPARGIKANPYMLRAAQTTEEQWTQLYMEELEKIIDRVEGD